MRVGTGGAGRVPRGSAFYTRRCELTSFRPDAAGHDGAEVESDHDPQSGPHLMLRWKKQHANRIELTLEPEPSGPRAVEPGCLVEDARKATHDAAVGLLEKIAAEPRWTHVNPECHNVEDLVERHRHAEAEGASPHVRRAGAIDEPGAVQAPRRRRRRLHQPGPRRDGHRGRRPGRARPRSRPRAHQGHRRHAASRDARQHEHEHEPRILRELIELAERDADAELVDALHDALDVAMPASSNGRCK